MKSSLSFAKAWFAVSLLVLGFGYGFVSHAWGLFPKTYMEQAWRQARSLYSSPDSIESVYDRSGVNTTRKNDIYKELTLVTFYGKKDKNYVENAHMINKEGKVVHEWGVDKENIFGDTSSKDVQKANVHGSYLLPDGDLLINLRYVGVARLSSCGDVVWAVNERTHHSVARDENGTFWVPGVSSERRSSSDRYPEGYPGLESPVWIDQVLNISADGNVLKEINLLDVLYENNLQRHIAKAKLTDSEDPTHLNDVEPLASEIADEYPLFEAGDLLVSLRNLDLVFVFDPETEVVRWHASHPFIWQHDPDFVGNGWIGVFDNSKDGTPRGKMLGGTRIVAVQPHTDSTEIRFPTPESDTFYTPIRGKWQLLNNSNMLLTESEAGRVVEVDARGRTVWEWIKPGRTVTKATRVDLTREEVASWPCSSVDSVSRSAQQQSTAP